MMNFFHFRLISFKMTCLTRSLWRFHFCYCCWPHSWWLFHSVFFFELLSLKSFGRNKSMDGIRYENEFQLTWRRLKNRMIFQRKKWVTWAIIIYINYLLIFNSKMTSLYSKKIKIMSVCAVIIVDMKAREMFTITPEAYFIKTVPHRILSHLLMPMLSMKILCITALALIQFFFLVGRNLMKLVFFRDLCKWKIILFLSTSWSSHKLRTYWMYVRLSQGSVYANFTCFGIDKWWQIIEIYLRKWP